jgi:hypothetical protein
MAAKILASRFPPCHFLGTAPKLQRTTPSNPKTLPSNLIPIPNPRAAFDLADLAFAILGGLTLTDLAHDLGLKLMTSNSPLTSPNSWLRPRRPQPQGGDLDLDDLGLKVVTLISVTYTKPSTSTSPISLP